MTPSKKIWILFGIGITNILFNLTATAENTDSAEYRAKVKKVCNSYNKTISSIPKIEKTACVYDSQTNNCEMTTHYFWAYKKATDCSFENCNCGSLLSKDTNCIELSHQSCVQKSCEDEIKELSKYGQTLQETTMCTTPEE